MAQPAVKKAKQDGDKPEKELTVYEENDMLFEAGDPGGDLYFIKSGKIRIFIEKDDREVELSILQAGEIIGVLTCFNNLARTASAKALTEVQCQVVSAEQFKKLMENIPPWLKLLLKDLVGRFMDTNEKFVAAHQEISELKRSQMTIFTLSEQVASTLHVVGSLMIQQAEEGWVPLAELTKKVKEALNIDPGAMAAVMNELKSTEILAPPSDQVTEDQLGPLQQYREFMRKFHTNRDFRKQVVSATATIRRAVLTLMEYYHSVDAAKDVQVTIPVEELRANFEEITGRKYDEIKMREAIKLGLVAFTEKPEPVVAITLDQLSPLMRHIEIYHRLTVKKTKQEV